MKLHPPLLRYVSLASLDDFARDPKHCITFSPFGLVESGGTLATKSPPVAKGLTYAQLPSKIKSGLDNAIKMSRAHRGETGVVVAVVHGQLKRLPRKAYNMYLEAQGIKIPA